MLPVENKEAAKANGTETANRVLPVASRSSCATSNSIEAGSHNTIPTSARARYYASLKEKERADNEHHCSTSSTRAQARYHASLKEKTRADDERHCSTSSMSKYDNIGIAGKESKWFQKQKQRDEKVEDSLTMDTISMEKKHGGKEHDPEHGVHGQPEDHHVTIESSEPAQNEGQGFPSPVQEDGLMILETDFLSRSRDILWPAEDIEGRPGAFRVGGRRDDDDDIDSSTDDEDDDDNGIGYEDVSVDNEVPELPAELVTGTCHKMSELRQLRQAFANVVEAQMMVDEKKNAEEVSSQSSAYGKRSYACWCIILLLVAITVVMGTTFCLRENRSSPTVASPAGSNASDSEGTTLPTRVPTTVPPTVAPTAAPSSAMEPSQEPTLGDCELRVDVSCKKVIFEWDNGQIQDYNCSGRLETPDSRFDQCYETPFRVSLLYNGGSCSQSDDDNLFDFKCNDTTAGPPPVTEEGSRSYIVVTDTAGKDLVYFAGYVRVGENYNIPAPDVLEDGIWISIYSSEDKGTLLQEVKYDGELCSTLELSSSLYQLGASQPVAFENRDQGKRTSIASIRGVDIVLQLNIHQASGGAVILQNVTSLGEESLSIDWTEDVAGKRIEPGRSISLEKKLQIPLGKIDVSVGHGPPARMGTWAPSPYGDMGLFGAAGGSEQGVFGINLSLDMG